jgi:hypothetical protein
MPQTTPYSARTLADLVAEKLGVRAELVENESGITTVGTSVVILLPVNPNRVACGVINLSTNTIYARPKNQAAATAGITLAPNGGFMQLIWEEDFELTGYEWTFVASGAGSAVYSYSYRVF